MVLYNVYAGDFKRISYRGWNSNVFSINSLEKAILANNENSSIHR